MNRATTPAPTLTPIRDADFGYEQARHLLWRAGFGGSPQQIQTLASWGPNKAVDYLIDADKIDQDWPAADLFDHNIMRPFTRAEREQAARARREDDRAFQARLRTMRQDRQRRDRRQIRKIQHWWLTRMIETPRPLEEKMTLFWHGHFATSYRTIENSYHMFLQNQLLRKHALGNYGELLHQIIRDPAMIAYLDNNDSRRNSPNENLAREIMELFSLGVGNYTENDIKEGARALTGYTFADDQFTFVERNHDNTAKTILGRTGRHDGDDFVDIILAQRACPRYMARKLYKFFVASVPDNEKQTDPEANAFIRDLASLFFSRNYAIKPVLEKLFLSKHFYSPSVMNEQIKSPAQLTVGAVRTLGPPTRDLSILLDAMDLMGQSILFPPSVKGWDGGRSWINTSTLYVRQNTLSFLLTGKKPAGYDAMADKERYDPSPLLAPLAGAAPGADRDINQVVDYLMRFTLGRTPPKARASLLKFAAQHDNRVTPELVTGLLLLITAMPEYQLC